jgi:hypothetical protein
MTSKAKGYRVERKIRILLENNGWKIVRAGASLGEADLVCLKDGKCILLQIKSTKKKVFYYYEYMDKKLSGFPFYLVVDFGYGAIRATPPKQKVTATDGISMEDFLRKI